MRAFPTQRRCNAATPLHATAEEQWRPAELTAAGVPPPPPRDSLAGTRAVVRTIPTRLALHPTIKNKLVPHPLVTLAL